MNGGTSLWKSDDTSLQTIFAEFHNKIAQDYPGYFVNHTKHTTAVEAMAAGDLALGEEVAAVDNADEDLFEAVRRNNLDTALRLIRECGANVNKMNYRSKRVIYLALENEHVPMVKMLLANGADVNAVSYCNSYCANEAPIVTAARSQHAELVTLLLSHGCRLEGSPLSPVREGKTALQWAATHGNVAIAEELLSHGADVNWIGMYFFTALHYAAISDQTHMVKWLLENDAEINVNGDGRSPLHIAAVRGQLEIIRALYRHRCMTDTKDNFKFTAFSLACLRGHLKVVEFMLERTPEGGCERLDLDDGLLRAAESGHVDVMECLLRRGADVNAANESGETALSVACKGQTQAVAVLLDHGARINVVDNRGHMPLQLALMRDQVEIATSLIVHGARLNGTAGCDTDSPLWIACTACNPVLVKYVLQTGCRLTQEPWFTREVVRERQKELEFRIPRSASFRPEAARQRSIWEWVMGTFGRPRSLMNMCRMAVREHMARASDGASIVARLEKLPIPVSLVKYLALDGVRNEY